MRLNQKNIFLVDGIGAMLTAVSLGLALPLVPEWIGLDIWLLRSLGGLGALYGVYSLSRYYRADTHNGLWLRILMVANLAYCLLTGVLVAVCFGTLKPLGLLYFVGEIVIIGALVGVEYRVYRRHLHEYA